MPLPGGPADKLGNRYENWWTVYQLARILQGGYESIRIESPGVDKAEFFLRADGAREWHQAKRSHPSGRWALADLCADGLLRHIGYLLAGNADRFVFVSASDARDLAEIADRARDAANLAEFQGVFLASKSAKRSFEKLVQEWNNCAPAIAYDVARRIEVRTQDENSIADLAKNALMTVFLDPVSGVVNELRGVVQDAVHRELKRAEIADRLRACGFSMRQVRPESAPAWVERATSNYLDGTRSKLIGRKHVPRSEVKELLRILGGPPREVVLTGRAGGGKTACLIQFIDELRAMDIPVLALRLDRIQPASSARDLGRNANLEESPSLVLAAAAQKREAVLVLDQLDAISTVSGRSGELFDAVASTLAEVRARQPYSTMHVVLACRAFDWHNDDRLRGLVAEGQQHVTVDLFPVESVRKVLAQATCDTTLLSPRQLDLLRLPQNLALFLNGAAQSNEVPRFRSAADLFETYWSAKRKAVRERLVAGDEQWMVVIERLVDEMTRRQQLFVLREALDSCDPDYVQQMCSEGVLTFDGQRYGFGHESFFDYCLARIFANRNDTLVELLVSDEQHLFRRSQVRQVLAYLRDTDRSRYLRELGAVLTERRVRAHIKDVALAVVCDVDDPHDDEWALLRTFVDPMLDAFLAGNASSVDKLAALAWHHVSASPSWFRFAIQSGSFAAWLAADGLLANVAVNLLHFHGRHSPDLVAELLEPYVDAGGDWPLRLRSVVEWADHAKSRRMLELTLRLIDNGVLDNARGPIAENSTFWSIFYGLGKAHPEWVPEVIAGWLRRRLTLLVAKGEEVRGASVFGRDQFAAEPFNDSAAKAPHAFVQHILPVVLHLSDQTASKRGAPPRRDSVWTSIAMSDYPGPDDACLAGLTSALAALAREGTDLRSVVDELRGRDTYIANYLLQGLYAAGAVCYADEAANLLADEPWRLACGYSDSPNWTATELVRAVAPLCGAEPRRRLEAAILAYLSPWERSADGYKAAGFASFSVLSAFPPEILTVAGRARLRELERKFVKPSDAPQGIRGGQVVSPIERHTAERLTDEQWLRAIGKYSKDEHELASLRGGAVQLSQVLGEVAATQPERFAELALRLNRGDNPLYMGRIVDGLRSSTIADDLKLSVCRKALKDAGEACGRPVADLLETFASDLPEEAVAMLTHLATEHSDPQGEAWATDAGGGHAFYNGDIYLSGINSTRGNAALVIARLIDRDGNYAHRFGAALEALVLDPSLSVRSCVAAALRALAYRDQRLALALFERMRVDDERLLANRHIYEFLRFMVHDHFTELRPTIERMVRSNHPDVSRNGARVAGIAALLHEEAVDLDRELATGSLSQRLGLCDVAVANIATLDYCNWCETRLIEFFDDLDASVRQEAGRCFGRLESAPLERHESLIRAFVGSLAFRDAAAPLLKLLDTSSQRLPGITCAVCETFLDDSADAARDEQTRRPLEARTVSRLVFRTYEQHKGDELARRALDLIDRLCLERIGDTAEEFEAFER